MKRLWNWFVGAHLKPVDPPPTTTEKVLAGIIGVLFALVILAGCQTELMSDDRIKENVSATLGEPASAVTLTDRRDDGVMNTYVVAHTHRGLFSCSINGGSLMTYGMANPPTCNRL